MSSLDPDVDERQEILRRDIIPLHFPEDSPSPRPTLVILSGQPGAGRSRATTQLIDEYDGDLAVVSGDDLRGFHPRFVELAMAGSTEASQILAQASADWVRGCIRFARENRRSLLLEGTFQDPSAVAATAARFAAEGFRTRAVVVGTRRAESLLSVASRYLRDVQTGGPARYTSREAHDRGLDATRALVAAVPETPAIDRLTVLSRDGRTVFDAHRADGEDAFDGARDALTAAQSARLSRFDATQWLSELHHATDFAASRRDLSRGVTELLVDLHETSLREVIPELHVPAGGKFTTAMEQATAARLVALRGSLPQVQSVDAAAPLVAPGAPERGGVSR